jgi:hypothetical protein
MPFSKHHVEPEHLEAMRAAFYKVCDALLLKGEIDDPMTGIVSHKIVPLVDLASVLTRAAAASAGCERRPPVARRGWGRRSRASRRLR